MVLQDQCVDLGMYVELSDVLSFAFEGELCSMFYHGIQFSVNARGLYLIFIYHDILWPVIKATKFFGLN